MRWTFLSEQINLPTGYFNYINQANQQIQAAAAQPALKEEDVEIIPPEDIQD